MTLQEQVLLLIAENKNLREENKNLREENKLLREIIIKLEERIAGQEAHILKQDKRIAELEEELRKARISKNSGNSSKPPSSDISSLKRNQSLSQPSGKRSGGQPGHKGQTLEMTDTPDEIIEINPNYCNKCGCNLEHTESHFESRRQEIDIPPRQAIIKEYRLNSKTCPNCGHQQESEFPAHITNYVQYGTNVESLIAYLSIYQHLPFKRLKELFCHVLNLGISEGTVDNILKRIASKAQPIYDKIKETILSANQVGADETSAKVNGKKKWIWAWQTHLLTFLTASESRGSKTIETIFPNGLKNSILNSDRWAAQLKTPAKGHQLCLAHLQRDLNYLQELEGHQWSYAMSELLKESLYLKNEKSEYTRNDPRIMQLEANLDAFLAENIPKNIFHKTYALQKSLIKQRGSIFTFLYYKDVPADNNASERAIRNVKVKLKVSGQFKSNENIFCIIRSVIDTCKKRGVDILSTLNSIARLVPAE